MSRKATENKQNQKLLVMATTFGRLGWSWGDFVWKIYIHVFRNYNTDFNGNVLQVPTNNEINSLQGFNIT